MSARALKITAAGVAAATLALGGTAWAVAGSGDEDSVSGPQADRAGAAAVAHLGGGSVQEVERDDGGAAWEVEVQQGGREVEVALDDNLKPVGSETEDDGDDRENDEGESEDED
jgi:hypothetical protein